MEFSKNLPRTWTITHTTSFIRFVRFLGYLVTICIAELVYTHTHTHTHTYIYIYIYIIETRAVETGGKESFLGKRRIRILLAVFCLNWILGTLFCPHSLTIFVSTPVGLLNLKRSIACSNVWQSLFISVYNFLV